MAGLDNSIRRLQQTTNHINGYQVDETSHLSIIHGVTEPALVNLTLGELLNQQCLLHGEKECLVLPWTDTRWTYSQLRDESRKLAKALLSLGVQHGDRIGILAGNCEEYVALFFAAGYIGSILVVLNSTYTVVEAQNAIMHSGRCLTSNLTIPF